MNKIYTIYCLTNYINKKKYIGVTSRTIQKRINSGYYDNKSFLHDIKKYGWKNFEKKALYTTNDKEEAYNKEKYYIKFYNTIENGYNSQTGGYKNFESIKIQGKHLSPLTEFKKGIHSKAHLVIMQPVLCVETGIKYESIKQAESELSLHHIWDCIKGKRNKCGGYHWEKMEVLNNE